MIILVLLLKKITIFYIEHEKMYNYHFISIQIQLFKKYWITIDSILFFEFYNFFIQIFCYELDNLNINDNKIISK